MFWSQSARSASINTDWPSGESFTPSKLTELKNSSMVILGLAAVCAERRPRVTNRFRVITKNKRGSFFVVIGAEQEVYRAGAVLVNAESKLSLDSGSHWRQKLLRRGCPILPAFFAGGWGFSHRRRAA